MDLPRVRLFVSSPGDVEAERKRVERVVERLNGVFREAVAIDVIRWENEFYTADRPFQAQIAEASETDVVVAILWSRIGTPLGAPDAPRRPDGSEYESGTVYEIETALLASRAKGVPDLYVFRKTASPVVPLGDKERLRLAEEQYDLLHAFWRKWFQTEEGHFRAAFQTFATTDAFETQVEALLRDWLAAKGYVAHGPVWDVRIEGSPFRGLEPFEERHARVFFGRAFAVERCRERLIEAMQRGSAFLLVLGASGAGKSSLARAGLVPRLTAPGAVPGVDFWRRAVFRPGPSPFAALAAALFEAAALPELSAGDFPAVEDLARQLAAVPEDAARPLVHALDRAAGVLRETEGREHAADIRLLLVVDQLEEAFAGGDDAAAFGQALATLAGSGRVAVIATLRGDRYVDLLASPPLLALKEAGATFDLPLPGESDIEAIIREPIRAAGLRFERREPEGPDLGEELQAAAGGADALPLLQMTLEALFLAREGDRLTVYAYDALGGLEGAIAARAEAALDGLPEPARAELPALLRALTRIGGAEGEFATQPVKRDRFAKMPERRALLDALVSERLLVADRDGRVRVAHEALLRRWARAQDILMAERDFLHVRDRLAPLAADWQAKTEARDTKADDYLLPAGPLLSAFDALKAHGRDADLPDDIRTFAARSSVAAKRAASRKVRNLRITVAGLSALTLAAVVAGVVALQQWQTAQRHFELALSAATGIVYDLAQGLRDVAGMRADTVARILGTAQGIFERLLRALPDDPRLLREQSVMLDEFATTYQTQGDLAQALKSYQASLAIRERLADADPGNAGWQRDLSVSHNKIGDVLRVQGDLAQALKSYQASLAIRERLADADPGNAGWQRDLSVSQAKIGDVLVEQGDLAQALKSYQASLAIAQRLADADPGNAGWQRDLSVSQEKIGDVLRDQGDLAQALKSYQASLAIAQRLADADPGNAGWQRDLSVSQEQIGDVLVEQGDLAQALKSYQASLAIRERLADADPGNAGWQRDLSVSHIKIGDVLVEQGDLAQALKSYQASLAIAQRLADADPGNAGWQRDLSVSQEKIGDVLRDQGDLAQALKSYQASLAIRERLADADPGNAGWQRDLSVSHNKIGDVLRVQGDLAQALKSYQASLAIRERLADADPGNAGWQRDLSVSHIKIGDVLVEQGDLAQALKSYQASLAIAQRLADADPGNAGWQRDLSVSHDRIGDVLRVQGNLAQALKSYQASLAIRERLADADPGNAGWQRDLALALMNIGSVEERAGRTGEAVERYRAAAAINARLVALDPSNAVWQNDKRWMEKKLKALGGGEARR